MLVLTRKKNESIMIGHDIEITIVSIDKDQIRIGINAPKHVDIHRKEVYIAIQEANKESQAGAKAMSLMDKIFPQLMKKPTDGEEVSEKPQQLNKDNQKD